MATVDQLVIEIRAETRKLRKGLDDVNKKLGRTEKSAKKTNRTFSKLGGAIAAIGFVALTASLINTIRKFEDLEATLRAVTGSTEAAAESFNLVRAFTARTVFQVDEVARSFITLKQAGIVPTSEVLQDFGNFAAGMGKSIEQLAQAAFNATTGEMEMLKQFGVIARQQGDKITVTFDGVTKTIDRSGESIIAFLREIGQTTFSTAIEERFKTLSGAIANLNDALDSFQVRIGESGATQGMVDFTKESTRLIEASDPIADTIGTVSNSFLRIGSFIIGSVASLFEFTQGAKDAEENLKQLDERLKQLIKTNVDFKATLTADEKTEFALFEKLNKDMRNAKFSVEKLVANDFADLSRIINKVADEKLKIHLSRVEEEVTDSMRETTREEIIRSMLGGMTVEEYQEAVKIFLSESDQLSEGIISMQRAIVASSEQFTGDFVDSLLNGTNALQAFKDFSKQIVSQIITIFLQMEVVNRILAGLFPNLGISYGGIISDPGGGAAAAATRSTGSPGLFASGGTVQRGSPVVVGERGAEIFVPNTGGTIMNNMNSANAVGGTPIVINQSVNFATGVVPTVRAEVTKMLPQISDVTKGAVLEAAVRGGSYRKGLIGRG